MFIEDSEWNDEQLSQTTSKPILTKPGQKSNAIIKFKPKGVGKKSLLRTLKTLGIAPDQKSHHVQGDSESEPESESAPARPKRKKKRNRGRKKTEEAKTETATIDEDKKADVIPKEIKREDSKTGSLKLKKTDSSNGKSKDTQGKREEDGLNRKQWKNKMKNRRKCKNKYREKELLEHKADTATGKDTAEKQKVDTGSSSTCKETSVKPTSQTKAKQKDPKPQKRKLSEPAETIPITADTPKLMPNKRPKKTPKVKTEVNGSPSLEANQETDKHPAEVEKEDEEDLQHATPSMKRQEMQKLQKERLRRERLRKMLHSQPDEPESPTENQEAAGEEGTAVEGVAAVVAPPPVDRSASLRTRMEQRLDAARFRYINEVLYTSTSGEAKRMFSQDPQAVGVYHKGFTAQVQRWPANPVDAIIAYIHKKPASHVVADFGCGDCKIALSVKNKVHSFDLAPICDLVTVCDMANVPLKDGSVHIAVFCLSLMGTNLIDFLTEANRVLVMGGVLKIAEVASRFDDLRGFLTTLSNLGFKMTLKDTKNSHFYSFDFLKTKDVSENMKSSRFELRPCVYKKR